MNTLLVAGPYGFLVLSGTLHFVVDVVSQRLRGVRLPGPETTLYYGLNSGFSLGQVALGAVGLWLASRSPELLREAPMLLITALAGVGWLAMTFLFMEYREPKIAVSIFLALFVVSAVLGRR